MTVADGGGGKRAINLTDVIFERSLTYYVCRLDCVREAELQGMVMVHILRQHQREGGGLKLLTLM